MGDIERKEVTVSDTNHLAELMGNIFSEIAYIHSMNMDNDRELRKERREMFYKFKHDYEVAQRSRLFFGMTSTRKVMNEANDYALNQMKKVSTEIDNTGDEQINRFIKLAVEAPKQFLEAIISVFQGAGSGASPQLMEGNNKVPDMIDILTKFEKRGNNDKKPVNEKRRKFR